MHVSDGLQVCISDQWYIPGGLYNRRVVYAHGGKRKPNDGVVCGAILHEIGVQQCHIKTFGATGHTISGIYMASCISHIWLSFYAMGSFLWF